MYMLLKVKFLNSGWITMESEFSALNIKQHIRYQHRPTQQQHSASADHRRRNWNKLTMRLALSGGYHSSTVYCMSCSHQYHFFCNWCGHSLSLSPPPPFHHHMSMSECCSSMLWYPNMQACCCTGMLFVFYILIKHRMPYRCSITYFQTIHIYTTFLIF